MHFDRKNLRSMFFYAAGCIALAWLLRDTARFSAFMKSIWGLFSPFVAGAAIAFVFNVPMRAIENQLEGIRREGLRRTLSIVFTLGALALVIAFVVELLVPQIRATVESLRDKIPAFADRTAQLIIAALDKNPELKEWIYETTKLENINWSDLLKSAYSMLSNSVSGVMGSAFSVIGNVTGAIVNGVISLVFAIYCLARKDILARQGKRILYSLFRESRADEILRVLRLTNATFSDFISGQCLEALILGGLFAVSMTLFKMPYVPLVSVIIAVTALVPVVGAFVGCFFGAFFILVNDPVQAATFIVLFLVIQQLEGNLIYPKVVGESVGLPGMWVLVAVTVGGNLLGIGGMLIMIPLASVCYALLKEFTDRRLEERNIPREKLEHSPPVVQSRRLQNREKKEQNKLRRMREKLKAIQQNRKNQ